MLLELLVAVSLTLSIVMMIYTACSIASQNRLLRRARAVEERRYDDLLMRVRRLEKRSQPEQRLKVVHSQGGAAK